MCFFLVSLGVSWDGCEGALHRSLAGLRKGELNSDSSSGGAGVVP